MRWQNHLNYYKKNWIYQFASIPVILFWAGQFFVIIVWDLWHLDYDWWQNMISLYGAGDVWMRCAFVWCANWRSNDRHVRNLNIRCLDLKYFKSGENFVKFQWAFFGWEKCFPRFIVLMRKSTLNFIGFGPDMYGGGKTQSNKISQWIWKNPKCHKIRNSQKHWIEFYDLNMWKIYMLIFYNLQHFIMLFYVQNLHKHRTEPGWVEEEGATLLPKLLSKYF